VPASLHGLLERSSARRPEGIAVVDGHRSITYGELDRRANRLAWALRERGLSRGDRVGLYLDKSIEAITAIYGTLKAGGVYVPLDVTAPPARVGKIAADCGLRVLVSEIAVASRWSDLLAAGANLELVLCVDASVADGAVVLPGVELAGPDALDACSTEPPAIRGITLDLAYVLYTSGSTGVPKGVKLSHQNGLAFVSWAVRALGLCSEDRFSSHAPFHFDLSIFDLFAAALVGAPIVLVPRQASLFPGDLVKLIAREEITVWYSVPSVLTMVATRGGLGSDALATLRVVLFAGEVFPTKYLRLLMRQLPGVRLCNLYGPTETNVCTWYDVPSISDDETQPIPIGRPIDDVEAIVVTESGSEARVGEVGELLVRGPTVMQGYWGDADRSQRSLVQHPFDPEASDRLYRTGDLVEWLPDGNLRFLGRTDDQVKSRGYRIELGEVEVALHTHAGVVECAVLALPDEVFGNRLEAVVVSSAAVTTAELTDLCASLLPRYMVPETFHLRDELPRTSTGKVDRRALTAEISA
jgi:amino acid adenylation domain-containing protein